MKEDFIDRRTFFKKVVQKTLPILIGASALPTIISCVREDEDLLNALDKGGENGNGNNNNNNTNTDSGISPASGSIDGHEFVDLGLSVKWARYNYGASSPSSRGSYMEFTEGATGSNYTEIRLSLLQAGYESGDSIAGSIFDAISQKWGNKWRMPSMSEWKELISNSNIERYEHNNTVGLKFISKKNGKSIFLPGAGYKGDDNKYHYGYYWTSILSYIKANSASAYYIWWSFGQSGNFALHDNTDGITDIAMPIRAITNGSSNPSSCNNSCTANCANNSTNSGCSNCGANCSGGCKTKCDYNCAATCVNHCYGQCNDTCGGGCKYLNAGSNCSGCANTCSMRCYHACSYACSSDCQSSCVNGAK